eukprot:EG_transcript_38094
MARVAHLVEECAAAIGDTHRPVAHCKSIHCHMCAIICMARVAHLVEECAAAIGDTHRPVAHCKSIHCHMCAIICMARVAHLVEECAAAIGDTHRPVAHCKSIHCHIDSARLPICLAPSCCATGNNTPQHCIFLVPMMDFV